MFYGSKFMLNKISKIFIEINWLRRLWLANELPLSKAQLKHWNLMNNLWISSMPLLKQFLISNLISSLFSIEEKKQWLKLYFMFTSLYQLVAYMLPLCFYMKIQFPRKLVVFFLGYFFLFFFLMSLWFSCKCLVLTGRLHWLIWKEIPQGNVMLNNHLIMISL